MTTANGGPVPSFIGIGVKTVKMLSVTRSTGFMSAGSLVCSTPARGTLRGTSRSSVMAWGLRRRRADNRERLYELNVTTLQALETLTLMNDSDIRSESRSASSNYARVYTAHLGSLEARIRVHGTV